MVSSIDFPQNLAPLHPVETFLTYQEVVDPPPQPRAVEFVPSPDVDVPPGVGPFLGVHFPKDVTEAKVEQFSESFSFDGGEGGREHDVFPGVSV